MQTAQTASELALLFKSLIEGYLAVRKEWAESQRNTADEFNLLEVVGVKSKELSHSKLLAWLLDHRIEKGTHAQGNLGFRLFLQELAGELSKEHCSHIFAYADEPNYWVHTEAVGDESRMDIEIAATGKFLIHIENKIHSIEGDDQTNREWNDLQVRRQALSVTEKSCHAIFLTLDGSKAKNPNFLPVGWSRIAKVMEQFAAHAEPPEVKLFAKHYAKAVRKLCVLERDEREDNDDNV